MEGVDAVDDRSGGQLHPPPPDAAIAGLDEVFHRRELLAVGLTERQIDRRVGSGRLRALYRGVYAASVALTERGRWLAAVKACGRGAVLSHVSAAALWRLLREQPGPIHVTVPRRGRRALEGIAVHQARALDPREVTQRAGLPVTTVARTLLDLAETTTRRTTRRAWDEAEFLRLLDRRAVARILQRADGRRGAPVLADLLAHHDQPTRTFSDLEERFLPLVAAAGVPRPQVNARVPAGGRSICVDFLWPAQFLAVETDGRAGHTIRRKFEEDRRRDRDLLLTGIRVVRFTWNDLVLRPGEVVATLRRLLPPTTSPA